MSTYDPRTLIRVLNDLKEEVQKFTQTSSDTLKQAEYTQSCAQERVNQALRWSAIATNQVKSDLEDVKEVETEVNSLLSQCSTAIDIAHETVAAVEQAQQRAEETLERWQAELQLALAWQARAEERLERAIRAFQRAERNLESAKRDLERTQANLERCAKDPERKSCNSEQRAYNNARAAVLQAIEELKVAETEVHAAQEELKMAKARVRCCQSAVDYAEQAVQHAHSAMEQAEQALNDAERSLESAESANRAVNNGQAKATEAAEQAEQVAIKIRQAETNTNEAQWHVQSARSVTDSAHSLGFKGCQELRYRADQLHLLNQGSFSIREKTQKVVASAPAFEVKMREGEVKPSNSSSSERMKIQGYSSELRRNLGKVIDNKIPTTDIFYPDGKYQAHHVIPGASANKSPLVRAAIEKAGFNIDSAVNGIYLPENSMQKSLIQKKTGIALPTHSGYHSIYSNLIDDILKEHWDDMNGINKDAAYFINSNDTEENQKLLNTLHRAIQIIKGLIVDGTLDKEDMYKKT